MSPENRAGARCPKKLVATLSAAEGSTWSDCPAPAAGDYRMPRRAGRASPRPAGKAVRRRTRRAALVPAPAGGVDAIRAGAADRGRGRDGGKRHRHARQQRQRAARKGAILPCEHERQHRQDAGAEDGQRPAEECES
jgi:hypothetical protein